jgi:putative transposase
VCFNHGPEFIAYELADCCRFNYTDTVFIDPGSPCRTPGLRASMAGSAEHLNGQQFDSLLEAQVLTDDWQMDYNWNTLHSVHGWLT